jgi:hypothetical protein
MGITGFDKYHHFVGIGVTHSIMATTISLNCFWGFIFQIYLNLWINVERKKEKTVSEPKLS